GDTCIIAHQVEAKRSVLADRFVDVRGDALGCIAAKRQTAVDERTAQRSLALLIDDATSRTAAESDRRGSLEHVDILIVERVTVIAAEIAHAVEEDVVACGKAADGEVVALRAAFARRQADACDIAQRVAQGGVSLLL